MIVIIGKAFHDPAKMRFTEYNDMIKAFLPDRADQSFYISVLPR